MRGIPVLTRLGVCCLLGWGLAAALPHSVGDAALTVPPPAAVPSIAAAAPLPPVKPALFKPQVGIASWYGSDHDGRLTASGVPFDASKLTAAHNTLPLHTVVKVTNLHNGKSVDVVINDRGPGIKGRTIDLSEKAAQKIGMKKKGLARVRIQPIKPPPPVGAVALE
jgi:rare lipoprotein A